MCEHNKIKSRCNLCVCPHFAEQNKVGQCADCRKALRDKERWVRHLCGVILKATRGVLLATGRAHQPLLGGRLRTVCRRIGNREYSSADPWLPGLFMNRGNGNLTDMEGRNMMTTDDEGGDGGQGAVDMGGTRTASSILCLRLSFLGCLLY